MARATENGPKPLGLLWIYCPFPVAAEGLARIFEAEEGRVHVGREPPEKDPDAVILGVGGVEGLLEGIRRIRKHSPDALILVFGLYLDLEVAGAALRAGARGYVHSGMQPEQVIRAVEVAQKGEIVAPRQLLEYLISDGGGGANLDSLSGRQREVLELVDEGLTNAQIAERLYLAEATVKQHLRGAYKILGVRNRIEAARLFRASREHPPRN